MEIIARVGVLTISDKASLGKRTDESGETAARILQGEGFEIISQKIVPDDRRQIADT